MKKKNRKNVFRTAGLRLPMEAGVMTVTKRDGSTEPVRFDKILERLQRLGNGLAVNYHELSRKIIDQPFLPAHRRRKIDLLNRGSDAKLPTFANQLRHLRALEQGFGWHAPAQDAKPP